MIDIPIADIPRLYTALAEWLACLSYIIILEKRYKSITTVIWLCLYFIAFSGLQKFAGTLLVIFWIPCMMLAVGVIFLCIWHLCRLKGKDAVYICVRAFILAEFIASFGWMCRVYLTQRTWLPYAWMATALMLIVYAAIFTIYHLLEKRNIPKVWEIHCTRREMAGAILVALGTFLMSNISFLTENSLTNSFAIVYIRTLFDFVGLVMLFNQQVHWQELQARTEADAMKTILQRHYQQYQMSSENIELLKREFHDLKHLILAIKAEKDPEKKLGYLTQMEESIALQEAFIRTENGVLDTVLTTKGIYCVQNNIKFTCLGDGKLLEFMHAIDICSIFGNALDNAIESAQKMSDPDKRLINVSIYESSGFVMLEFENYFEENLVMKEDIPVTTKRDKFLHGYGLKSIRIAVEKYRGTMTLHTDNNWFTLRLLFPHEKEIE